MIVEVTGTGTHNKGAELMLVAIRDHFVDHPNVTLAVDQFFGTYEERVGYGLRQKMRVNGWGWSRLAVWSMPSVFRDAFGLVDEEDVDVVLDAAGFAFGDQHPPERTINFAERVEAAKRAGKTVILLPQAFGPFERPAIREAFARIVDAADLVFARDTTSLGYAREAAGALDHLRMAPDFTTLVEPDRNIDTDVSTRVCIVPNQRMVEKAESDREASAYVQLMVSCIEAVEAMGLEPVLLLHGQNDIDLAREIEDHLGRKLSRYDENDPVAIKKFLGESRLVIGSRFHALVGALSQGVPAVGTSWSHKYEMLFREYGCEDMLLPVSATEGQIESGIRAVVGPDRDAVRQRIKKHGEDLKAKTESLWRQVDYVLGLQGSEKELSEPETVEAENL
jgi:colanic acid/amylovoran biosynthesis protein